MINIAQNQVRRRSSLDDVALASQLKLLQQQTTTTPQSFLLLDNDDDRESKPRSASLTGSPPQSRKANVYIKPTDWNAVLETVLPSLLLGVACGAVLCYLLSLPSSTPTLEFIAADMDRCVENVTWCKQLDDESFRMSWASRFDEDDEAAAMLPYREVHQVNEHCSATCDFLFQKSTSMVSGSDAMRKLTQACKVGCGFAAQEIRTLGETNCQWSCKNTVWVLFPQRATCNYNKGLGLATFEFEKRYGEGVFGSGKACEVGCILGNSRPCPACDLDSRLHA